eukprot:TRINITY_DN1764_c0_g1_i5.p1 TRINITY_DN1764_c0_g1~~TRINITY_DN1764_c0_g1_i5.p1  ORF type:complete len:153 (-),score=30.82 TRINITY_DN1764_c0_g1_i5:49-507(-)
MLLYVNVTRPFKKREDNFINIFNEFIIVFSFASVLVMKNSDMSEKAVSTWGWVLTALVVFSLVATWVVALPGILRELKKSVVRLLRPKKKIKELSDKLRQRRRFESEYKKRSEARSIIIDREKDKSPYTTLRRRRRRRAIKCNKLEVTVEIE